MPKRPKMPKTPARPTPAPGVPTPVAYTGPSRNLRSMAQSIGTNKALSEFYSALVREQWEYDNDYRQSVFDQQRDQLRFDQEIGIQNNREWLKTGEAGRGMPAYSSLSSGERESETKKVADRKRETTQPFGVSGPDNPLSQLAAIVRASKESDDPDATYGALMKQVDDALPDKYKAPAEKKAESDEEERDWWGKLVHEVDESVGLPDPIADSIKGGAKMVADSPVGKVVGNVGGEALKQLSRPSHAVASAADAYFNLNDDPIKSNTREGSFLFGDSDNPLSGIGNMLLDNISPFGASEGASLDDLDAEGIKKIGSAFKAGWNLENDTTFSDVIKGNAERNPDFTVHDTLTYQTGAGITGDVVLDPLNLVGVGVVTKPLKLAQETKRFSKIKGIAEDVAKMNVPKKPNTIMNAGEDINFTADDVIDMLGGRKRYTNRAAAAQDAPRILENVNTLSKAIDKAAPKGNNKAAAVSKAGARVRAQLEAERAKFASEVVTESAVKRAAHAEATGDAPVGTADALPRRIEQQRVVKAMGAAKYKDADKFNEALGEAWAKNPVLTDKDRTELFQRNRNLTRRAYPAESARNSALIKQVEERKKIYEKTKGTEAKAAYDRAKAALARDNKKFNRLRADTFLRSARARINKNLAGHKDERYLKAVQKQAAEELQRLNVVPYEGGTFDIANRGDHLTEGAHVGTASDNATNEIRPDTITGQRWYQDKNDNSGLTDFPEIDDLTASNLWETDASKFGSRVQQLQAIHVQATKELDNLYPDVVPEGDLDRPIMDIPEAVQTPFGDIDPTKIQENLILDNDNMRVTVKEGVSPSAQVWLEDFAEAFNDEWAEQYSRLSQNVQRAANETAARKGSAEVAGEDIASMVALGDEDAKHFTEIFRNPDGSAIDMGAPAKKFAYPSFEHKGKRIFENSKELARMVDAPAVSRSEKMLKFIEDPTKLTEKDTTYVFERLKEFGYPVVNNPEAIHNYLTKNGIALREKFQPKQIAFAMAFKKKHGIPLEEALELRASVLGNTVRAGKGYENTRWAKAYPKGMSKAKFVHEVTGASGGAALRRVLDTSPFRISPKKDELGFPSPTTRPMSNSGGGWRSLSGAEFEKALDDAGMPAGSTLEDVEAQWYDDLHTYLNGLEPSKLKNKLHGIWDSSHKKYVTARKQDKTQASLKNREIETTKHRRENIEKSREKAFDNVAMRIEKGQQVSRQGGSVHLPHSLDELDTAKSVLAAKREEFLEQTDEARAALQEAKSIHDTPEIVRLEKRLNRLRTAYKAEKEAVRADLKEAREAKEVMKKRLREEAILNVANAEIIAHSKGLAFSALGKELTVPGTRTMFAAAEKAGGLPVIKSFFESYKNAFASQANLLPDEMLYIRNRAISDPSKLISEHIRTLKATLGQIPLKARTAAGRDFMNGMDTESSRMIGAQLDSMLPYFQHKVPVGDGMLSVGEINAYLPEHLKFRPETEVKSSRDLYALLSNHIYASDSAKSQKARFKAIGKDADPVDVIWNTRIAIEQAMAKKAMVHALNETFGVRREFKVNRKTGQIVSKKNGGPAADTIERLKDEGWRTVDGLNHTHYFPPETAQDIARMLEMFKPMNAGKVGKLIDEVTGIWKTSVTIYNIPGYYIRNGIGEVMSAWLAGVNSPKPYYKSAQVWRYTSKETKQAEALASMKPELNLKVETADQIGKKHVVTLQNGTQVDVAKVHAWYRDQGLATGFINTEYRHHYNKFKEKLHSSKVVQKTSNANEGLRQFNENYEDFYRMAHFIDKLGKAPKGMGNKAAAEWAAKSVRKYHFDYTDFTHAEKAVMLRIFPFYKWTRKALPLMSSMLFVKPGKMMVYPKVMEGLSESLVSSDDLSPGEEHNGFMPNFHGVVPSSIADMWSYQVGGETGYDAEGEQQYFRMSTPQMDSLNGASNPMNLGESLLNPLIKAPIEQLKGETLGMDLPVANDPDSVEEEDGRLINNRWSHLMSMFPPGSIAAGIDRGDMDDDALIRLLTGMGYRDVSEAHRNMLKGEGYR